PPAYEPKFSPLIAAELERISSGKAIKNGVDQLRYESQNPPSSNAPLEDYRAALQRAYSTSPHLSNRVTNLTLLSTFGQNSWLIGNSQLEGILEGLERELAAVKEETDEVNRERKRRQMDVQEELQRLDRRWKDGVGKV